MSVDMLPEKKSFQSCYKGFWLKFPCGLTLSTQFGVTNYCENAQMFSGAEIHKLKELLDAEVTESSDCEIAVFKKNCGHWQTKEVWKAVFGTDPGDDVVGHVTMKDWLKVVAYLTNLK